MSIRAMKVCDWRKADGLIFRVGVGIERSDRHWRQSQLSVAACPRNQSTVDSPSRKRRAVDVLGAASALGGNRFLSRLEAFPQTMRTLARLRVSVQLEDIDYRIPHTPPVSTALAK